MEKTNVMRLLDVSKVEYSSHEYDEAIVDGLSVASSLGEDPECVFKSLVCEDEHHNHFIFEVPVNHELNLKKAAKACGAKSVSLIRQKELLPLTGYVHGGCSPIGLKKPMPVYIEETAQLFDKVFVSAGKRGYQIELSPFDLAGFVQGQFVPLVD